MKLGGVPVVITRELLRTCDGGGKLGIDVITSRLVLQMPPLQLEYRQGEGRDWFCSFVVEGFGFGFCLVVSPLASCLLFARLFLNHTC